MKLKRLNRALHRDLGYFFFGITLIYAVSGISLNHRNDWNPNFIISTREFTLNQKIQTDRINRDSALTVLRELKIDAGYKTHLLTGKNLRIFVDGGSVNIDLDQSRGSLEILRKRPLFNQINFLHRNTPGKLWTWFSDLYALALIALAISGLFIIKGPKGIKGRGAWLTVAGILVPIVFLYFYR